MAFLSQWKSHGRPIQASISFPFNHIIEIVADSPVSGCAIDELFRHIHQAVKDEGLTLLPTEFVLVFLDGNIFSENFYEIIKKYKSGNWPSAARVVDIGPEGVKLVSVENSRIAIHLR